MLPSKEVRAMKEFGTVLQLGEGAQALVLVEKTSS